MIRKRTFSALVAVTFLAIFLVPAIAQPTLNPLLIPKYQSGLIIPPSMPAKFKTLLLDYYEIAVRQFQQQILPVGLPLTTVWSYGPAWESAPDNEGLHATAGGHYFYPAFTIEARSKKRVRVKWINELKYANGNYRSHLLPVDQTLHWANPPGGVAGRDTRPTFGATPGPYTGPVPIVTHLHGSVGVGDESDGYAEAWYLPAANNIPAGYASVGTWHNFFKAKAQLKFWQAWSNGSAVFQYPNDQRAATLWYHDHTLGMTRLNVYAGPAGFYLVRGGSEDLNLAYNHPGPNLFEGVDPNDIITEIPIAIQDRSFNDDGSLFYPDSRAFFDGFGGPYIPFTDVSPIWNPEFFGNAIVVNGQTWPFLEVQQRRYRFRVLNGCNSRVLILKFDNSSVPVWQIGNEGGFLPNPIDVSSSSTNGVAGGILLGLAERADLIVDFSSLPLGTTFRLLNFGPDEPFGGGVSGIDFPAADSATTGQIIEFRVVGGAPPTDPGADPAFLTLPVIPTLADGATTPLALLEMMSNDWDGPAEAMLGTMSGGVPTHKMWSDPITENPMLGETQVWEFYNFTEDAHPMHIHEIHFQVVNRQAVTIDANGNVVGYGAIRPPEAWEDGSFKDTVLAYPGEVTRVRAKWKVPGLFVWHCHIVEHEDNEMMRPYFIGGAPFKFLYNFYIQQLGRQLF